MFPHFPAHPGLGHGAAQQRGVGAGGMWDTCGMWDSAATLWDFQNRRISLKNSAGARPAQHAGLPTRWSPGEK